MMRIIVITDTSFAASEAESIRILLWKEPIGCIYVNRNRPKPTCAA